MQDYRRKFERASSTIESLERDRKRCEARLSAVDFTWNLVSLSPFDSPEIVDRRLKLTFLCFESSSTNFVYVYSTTLNE